MIAPHENRTASCRHTLRARDTIAGVDHSSGLALAPASGRKFIPVFLCKLLLAVLLASFGIANGVRADDEENIAKLIREVRGGVVRDQEAADRPIYLVSLIASRVADKDLKVIVQLKHLRILKLGRTKITDAGLKELAISKSLTDLDLAGTEVTDAGMKEVNKITSLEELGLYETKVSDAGLKELKGLVNLINVNLDNTQITDAGLGELKALKKLRNLYVVNTKVSEKGINDLKNALPNLIVVSKRPFQLDRK